VVAAGIADQVSPEDNAWAFQVPANAFFDVDGDQLAHTAMLASGSLLPGWLSFNAATRTFFGTPPLDFVGALDLRVDVSDGVFSAFDVFRLTVTAVNDAPVAQDGAASGDEGTDIGGTLVASDVDSALLTFGLVNQPANGTVVVNADGTFVYTPNANFSGADSFTFLANDGQANSNLATVALAVNPVANGLTFQASDDLNGNGSSEVLWRHDNGEVLLWQLNGTSVQAQSLGVTVQAQSLGTIDNTWTIAGTGDLEGDGTSSIVWRHANGTVQVDGNNIGQYDNAWLLQLIDDFDGDGRDEFVWRHVNGEVVLNGTSLGQIDNAWTVQASGNFAGNGGSELAWRHVNGEVLIDGHSIGVVDNAWQIQGAGDFNADQHDELVWRHANGELMIDGHSFGQVDNTWTLETIDDFDGDGTDELLWRHVNGDVQLNGENLGNLPVGALLQDQLLV
jgi:hypothetical protein